MTRTTRLAITGLILTALALTLRVALAQEHPGRPIGGQQPQKGEHPDKPAAKAITAGELGRAIEDYIKNDTRLKGSFFLVYDAQDKKPLVLTLDKVHKDQLAEVEKGFYFACVDFKSADGVAYDLDFLMKQGAGGQTPTEVLVHKVAGKPRYEWHQEGKDGPWKRRPPAANP
ncbi:MAG: hypothetical protein AB1716_10095 [Planctomycetota bacterium]